MTVTADRRPDEGRLGAEEFLQSLQAETFPAARELGAEGVAALRSKADSGGLRSSEINNRRYLGNKHGIAGFIRSVVESECPGVEVVVDIFSGTGAVANAFIDKTVITNDLLYSNYLVNLAWFSSQEYRPGLILRFVEFFNATRTSENNYVRENFADTYFSADDCSKIGFARELVEQATHMRLVNEREYAILVTTILYGMDRAANTVGHYDAFRRDVEFTRNVEFPMIFPQWDLPAENAVFNEDANTLIETLQCDLLYLDPPYNSRQYSDAYHLLENIARWQQPEVFGVARKMDRTTLKSDYNTIRAPEALRGLIAKANARYIVFSYNNMADKGNGRSNAKISDDEILEILNEKGEVSVFETPYRAFTTGKSDIQGNAERLFVCKVKPQQEITQPTVLSPINYIGGKGRLVPQLRPHLPHTEMFVDVFAGGCTVGVNANADEVWFNDYDPRLVQLMEFLSSNDPEEIIAAVDATAREYGLTNTYLSSYDAYGCHSSAGLAPVNKAPYVRLRTEYNAATRGAAIGGREQGLLLYMLVIFGFNNQLRFNSKGDFNLPVGKRDFNSKMRKKLLLFNERMQQIRHWFTSLDFREIDIAATPSGTLFYCDPPYLITQATYNERGAWAEKEERDLLDFLDRIDASGRRFALSNVTESKGRSNEILKSWIDSRGVTVHGMKMSYANSNYQRGADTGATIEVLITNY